MLSRRARRYSYFFGQPRASACSTAFLQRVLPSAQRSAVVDPGGCRSAICRCGRRGRRCCRGADRSVRSRAPPPARLRREARRPGGGARRGRASPPAPRWVGSPAAGDARCPASRARTMPARTPSPTVCSRSLSGHRRGIRRDAQGLREQLVVDQQRLMIVHGRAGRCSTPRAWRPNDQQVRDEQVGGRPRARPRSASSRAANGSARRARCARAGSTCPGGRHGERRPGDRRGRGRRRCRAGPPRAASVVCFQALVGKRVPALRFCDPGTGIITCARLQPSASSSRQRKHRGEAREAAPDHGVPPPWRRRPS